MYLIEKKTLKEEDILINESLFSLGNGYLGARGNIDELHAPSVRGTYINGYYDEVNHLYGEKLYGFPEISQRQINIVEGQLLTILLDGEKVDLLSSSVSDYCQTLDMKKGYVLRRYSYETQQGKKATIVIRKLISQVEKTLLAVDAKIEFDGEIIVKSAINADVLPLSDDNDPRVGSHNERMLHTKSIDVSETTIIIESETSTTKIPLKTICKHVTTGKCSVINQTEVMLHGHQTLSFTKYMMYYSARHMNFASIDINAEIDRVTGQTFDQHLHQQEEFLASFWLDSDIVIAGDDVSQQGIRFSLFQLLQSVGKDGMTNISAKGLTGEGYEGHTFWDTEIYIIPSLLMSNPEWVKSLLIYRYSLIEESRKRARQLGHQRGIKFPWRTITGPECSAFFPAGTAQYHINGDIAYSIIQYYLVTKDDKFMLEYGLEMLLETSLLWLELGHFSEKGFCIDAVTGPDEYSCVVDNNYYTNAICQYQMKWLVKLMDKLTPEHGDEIIKLLTRVGVSDSDIVTFERVAKEMYLPFDQEKNIHLQDDAFVSKKTWDFANTPKENYPLLLHYHPLTIYRHQVLKQADTVLAHFMMEEGIDESVIRDTYHYYHPITTHDSSLSACVYGMMATRIGEYGDAFDRFEDSLMLDLENRHGNTKDGLHFANIGGTIMMIKHGFLGMRVHGDGLYFRPWLPNEWESLTVKLTYEGTCFTMRLEKQHLSLEKLDGNPIDIHVFDKCYTLEDKLNISW